jgi:hypothetical protein
MDLPRNVHRKPARPPIPRVCDSCKEYAAHINHPGLLYDHFTAHESNIDVYHRHVTYCPDLRLDLFSTGGGSG